MISFSNLDRQHDNIKAEISYIENAITAVRTTVSTSELALHISRLAGQLKIHLMEEDKFLYPELLRSEDPKIRSMTEEYISQMGNLAAEYTDFKNKYNIANKINANIDNFYVDAKHIITALKERILREDRELYFLVKAKKL